MRRAKIVCTLGPATDTDSGVVDLIRHGMSVARLNLSHGSHEDHQRRIHMVRRASEATGVGIAVLADLQGPKIRLGTFAAGPVVLPEGAEFTITVRDVPGDAQICSTTYAGLPGDVNVGDDILIDDGHVGLRAVAVTDTDVRCVVTVPGRVSNHKGINLPGIEVSVPALSDKDKDDLRWALQAGVDLVALSFVQRPEDIDDVRAIMDEVGWHRPVLAKIEKPQAVDRLEAIIEAFDGISSRWNLAEKIGRSLSAIHDPVPGYQQISAATDMAFDRLTTERPMWRLNWSLLDDAALFQNGRHRPVGADDPGAMSFRVERQTLRKLSHTGAVVFTIRTYRASLAELVAGRPETALALAKTLESVDTATREYKGWTDSMSAILGYLASVR